MLSIIQLKKHWSTREFQIYLPCSFIDT